MEDASHSQAAACGHVSIAELINCELIWGSPPVACLSREPMSLSAAFDKNINCHMGACMHPLGRVGGSLLTYQIVYFKPLGVQLTIWCNIWWLGGMLSYMCIHYTMPWYYNLSVAILAQVRSCTKVISVLANWYMNLGSDRSLVLFSNCPAASKSLLSAPHSNCESLAVAFVVLVTSLLLICACKLCSALHPTTKRTRTASKDCIFQLPSGAKVSVQ